MGNWKWYYKNNKIQKEATYLDDEYHGTVSHYYENGNLEYRYKYNLGEPIDTAYFYAEDGKTITSTKTYSDGKLHGRRISYNQEGKLQLIRFYEYDRLIGYSYLDKEGKELPMIEIKNETVAIVSYFDNGNKAREMKFVNGKEEGEFKSYYYNGNIYSHNFNKNDNYDGLFRLYYPNGKLKEERNYKDGERNGVSKKYYENGQLKEEVHYINDGKSGEAKYYTLQGKLEKTEKYFNEYIYETTPN